MTDAAPPTNVVPLRREEEPPNGLRLLWACGHCDGTLFVLESGVGPRCAQCHTLADPPDALPPPIPA